MGVIFFDDVCRNKLPAQFIGWKDLAIVLITVMFVLFLCYFSHIRVLYV